MKMEIEALAHRLENKKVLFRRKKKTIEDDYGKEQGKQGKKAGLIAVLIGVLAKSKALLFFLLKTLKLDILLHFFKLGSLGGSLVTMGLMAWTYAKVQGWYFAVGFVILLFIHEMGHYLAARYVGVEVSAPVFIPFMGAFISMKAKPENVEDEGKIAIAGPLAGTLATGLAAMGWMLSGNDLLKGLVYINLLITLFNLIPFGFLDGGRVASAFSGKLWLIGFLIFGGVALYSRNPLLLIFLVIGATGALKKGLREKNDAEYEYYDIDSASKGVLSTAYFGTLITNGVALAIFYTMENGGVL